MERPSDKPQEKYEIIKDLGAGNFGQVKLVRDKQGHQLYALKLIPLNRLSLKEKNNALNEVRLLASFDVPALIKYEGSFFNH